MSLRTFHIGTDWFPERQGGLARYYYELWRHLPAAGVDFRGVVVGSPTAAAASGGAITSVSSRSAPVAVRVWEARRVTTAALRADPDALIVSHFALYSFLLSAPHIGALEHRRLVIHFQGPWALEAMTELGAGMRSRMKGAVMRAIERSVYAHGTMFVVLSRAFREILARDYGVSPERIRVVPGGADVERFGAVLSRAAAQRALGWPTDRPIVWTVRRLVRRMGLENLVSAFDVVRRRVPEALLIIGGRGPLADDLAKRIADLGLDNHVQLAGYVPEDKLPLAYRAANLTVVPTVALEGFGLVAAESLAAGTPAMVTLIGGLPEVVQDLAPQLVLSGTSTTELADGIVGALRGEITLPTGEACQQFARERFAWPVIASRLREVYTEA